MDRHEKQERRRQFTKDVRALRDIFHEWDPIGFPTPDDEYDDLVHKVLSILYKGGGEEVVASEIKSVLEQDYGLDPVAQDGVESTTASIWKWWQGAIGQ